MATLMTEQKDPFYSKGFKCPVCENEFKAKKVRSGAIRTASRDTDFYTKYVGENPSWYEVLVCPNCGYSAFEAGFPDISPLQKEMIIKTIMPKWSPRNFCNERTLAETIEAHMLALVCYQVIGAKKSVIGKLCLRLAWLYREVDEAKEKSFMESAVRNLEEAYTTERLDEDKANEINVMYLIAELSRRLGNYSDAARWFSRLIAEPELKKNRLMNMKVREQMSQTREDNANAKAAVQ